MSKAFESQCEKISEELDKLSDWEMEFYLYCLLPRYADKLEVGMKDANPITSIDYLAKEQVRQNVRMLRMIRESLVYDLF